jgi:hypothetical protein
MTFSSSSSGRFKIFYPIKCGGEMIFGNFIELIVYINLSFFGHIQAV